MRCGTVRYTPKMPNQSLDRNTAVPAVLRGVTAAGVVICLPVTVIFCLLDILHGRGRDRLDPPTHLSRMEELSCGGDYSWRACTDRQHGADKEVEKHVFLGFCWL